jgi:hypothetical protein
MNIVPKVVKGDCECCDSVAVDVTLQHGNMWMCAACSTKEQVATQLIEQSKTIDSAIVVKADIYNAKTVAAIELRGAIEADSSIPDDQKEYAYAKACFTRFQNMQKVIFDKRQELLDNENELRMWQVNVQTTAGKLRAEYREQFKMLDVSYQPVSITKKNKSVKPVKAGKAFDKAAVFEFAKKYDVPASGIQSIVISRNMSPENAAKELAKIMGKL